METTTTGPFAWIEIYVDDMVRARKFYEFVFQMEMSAMPMPNGDDDMEMVNFQSSLDSSVVSGALVKMKGMKPGVGGTLVYFTCSDCSLEEARVVTAGGKVLQSKTSIGDYGFCAVVMDTEGNSIGLHSMN
jgi:predicted enzyme related to lactoylglutathione lyase